MLTNLKTQLTFTGDTDAFLNREWLLTNGTGSFAMGTALGANTRRYHGLLIAATQPPVGRVVVLHQLVEQLVLTLGDGSTQTLEFGPMLFPGEHGRRILAPDTTDTLEQFNYGLDATWSYQWRGLVLTRRLVLHDAAPACTVHYDVHGLNAACESAVLTLRPMLSLRDFHAMQSEHEAEGRFHIEATGDTLRVARGGVAGCYFMKGAAVTHDPQWWRGTDYPVEQRRGQQHREDLYAPAVFTLDLPGSDDAEAHFTAALGDTPAPPQPTPAQRQTRLAGIAAVLRRGDAGGSAVAESDPLPDAWARAADDFVVQRTVGDTTLSTIIAGYPWFADWGRDTFIALPGLLLCTGRHDEARDTLAAFAAALRGGLVPNRFDDADPTKAHYNTVDGSLWFVHSALEYLKHTGDAAAWGGWLAKACVEVVEGYRTGTSADAHDGATKVPIAMEANGLIAAGDAHSQLTWMDAAAPDHEGRTHVFTPRPGKCVEINALWYSALARLAEKLPAEFAQERKRYAALAPRVAESFASVFWSESRGYLTDHVRQNGEGIWGEDTSLRPNMMIACALEYSPVKPEHRVASIAAAKSKLLTPVGLRTLPQEDPAYHATYAGPAFERDGAYHRGVVWPWLIGPYAEAVLRAGGFAPAAQREAGEVIAPLIERLLTTHHPGALGQLHEIHEPEPPFAPRGCPAQAWSIAEVLRIWTLLRM